jgi:DNA helicase-2/ATP-dependent DNA helicase PcrA
VVEHDTLDKIVEQIAAGSSFVVEAGAGSGKTSSLIETLRYVIDQHGGDLRSRGQRIACITYTNVAKDEILSRLDQNSLVFVGTIHEFLWSIISKFQTELNLGVLEINAANAKNPVADLETVLTSVQVTYGQFGRHFDRGEIFHDDVIALSQTLFSKYPKIARIMADQYPFVFVDEYQDTSKLVVDLLMEQYAITARKPIVGFFGDSMQQIYSSDLDDITQRTDLEKITKLENYRCSKAVISVLNRLRPDLQQIPAGHNAEGDVHLYLSDSGNQDSYRLVMTQLAAQGWTNSNTKVLVLTHRGIAREVGYSRLLAAYGKLSFGNDRLNKHEEAYAEFFAMIEQIIDAYASGRTGDFLTLLGQAGYRVKKQVDKQAIFDFVTRVLEIRESETVADMLEFIKSSQFIRVPARVTRFEQKVADSEDDDTESAQAKRDFQTMLLAIPYSEVVHFEQFTNDHTPFSTKHGVKGEEYENVLVIIDDSLWTQYKFADVFSGNQSNAKRYEKTRKLLYVCLSRAMSGLAVLSLTALSKAELAGAEALLGVQSADVIA